MRCGTCDGLRRVPQPAGAGHVACPDCIAPIGQELCLHTDAYELFCPVCVECTKQDYENAEAGYLGNLERIEQLETLAKALCDRIEAKAIYTVLRVTPEFKALHAALRGGVVKQ
jgi:antirestriction protein